MKTKPTLISCKHVCLLLACFTAFAYNKATAQSNYFSPITLNYNNCIVPPLADYFMQGANASGLQIPKVGTNQVWDYSILEKNDAYNFSESYRHIDNAVFQNARRENDFVFLLGGIIALQETGYEFDDNNSFRRAGRSVDLQKFPLEMLTGNATDSLIINQQVSFDNGNFAFITYPCTLSSTWSNTVRDTTQFRLSVAVLGYDHSPGQFVQQQTLTRTVVGSGRMRIPLGSGKTPYIQVLMIKSVLTTVDSVYINGEPAPDALLAAFGITQGEQSSENCYIFLREGIDEPLITFNMDSSFTSISSIQYDAKYSDIYCGNREKLCVNGSPKCVSYALVTPALLQSDQITIGNCETQFLTTNSLRGNLATTAFQSVKIIPNPSQNQFTLSFSNSEKQLITVRVLDVIGRVLLQLKTTSQQITFGDQLKPGVYFAEVMQGNKKETIKLVKL